MILQCTGVYIFLQKVVVVRCIVVGVVNYILLFTILHTYILYISSPPLRRYTIILLVSCFLIRRSSQLIAERPDTF